MLISNYTVEFTLLVTLLVATFATAMGVTWVYETRKDRMPLATRFENLSELTKGLESEIEDRRAELTRLNRDIQERDRVAAEIATLLAQRDSLLAEISGLAESERQIEDVKRRAMDAAAEAAEAQAKRDEAKLELEGVEARAARLEREIVAHEEKLRILQGMPEELQRKIDDLTARQQSLNEDVETLRAERTRLLAAQEEVAELLRRKDALERTIAERQQECDVLEQRHRELDKACMDMRERRDALVTEVASLQAAGEELRRLITRKEVIDQDLDRLVESRKKLETEITEDKATLRQLADDKMRILSKIAEGQRQREEIAGLAARKAALETEIRRLEETAGVQSGQEEGSNDLTDLPLCLTTKMSGEHAPQKEQEALFEVREALRGLGLRYHDRIVDAFHTSLKINDFAQLSVLAGVPGTGKSLLPRVYAEAMGLSFLQIAIEPRWDSPQDLLGFYNYVEKRYRGTELARALVHMDPFNTSELAEKGFGDRMLLVLLDEMNLARVEYYFSEFLSRLEIRPRWQTVESDVEGRLRASIPLDTRRRASIPLDTRRKEGEALRLFPSHNVLFVGTMNDDESTQALSEKVLDRGNVMQFPAPNDFKKGAASGGTIPGAVSNSYRSHEEWRKWIQGVDGLAVSENEKARDVIGKLSKIMRACGRPFGHRLNEAMLAYVANYPRDTAGHRRLEQALADQVEMRILPKLRGAMLDDGPVPDAVHALVRLLKDDLKDSVFAGHLEEVLNRGGGQFNWRGMDREAG